MLFQSMGFQFSDITQFDELIGHAEFHSKQYGDNMLVFISKHYGELKAEHQEKHQEEEKDHEKLPFNHSSCSHTVHTIAFVLDTFKSNLQIPDFTATTESNFYYQVPVSNLHEKGLFQPPRIS
jgi:hypothetical protein